MKRVKINHEPNNKVTLLTFVCSCFQAFRSTYEILRDYSVHTHIYFSCTHTNSLNKKNNF